MNCRCRKSRKPHFSMGVGHCFASAVCRHVPSRCRERRISGDVKVHGFSKVDMVWCGRPRRETNTKLNFQAVNFCSPPKWHWRKNLSYTNITNTYVHNKAIELCGRFGTNILLHPPLSPHFLLFLQRTCWSLITSHRKPNSFTLSLQIQLTRRGLISLRANQPATAREGGQKEISCRSTLYESQGTAVTNLYTRIMPHSTRTQESAAETADNLAHVQFWWLTSQRSSKSDHPDTPPTHPRKEGVTERVWGPWKLSKGRECLSITAQFFAQVV